MNQTLKSTITLYFFTIFYIAIHAQTSSFSQRFLQEDFTQFREILENEHCCLYEYTSKSELDSMFDAHYRIIDHDMKHNEFFMLLAPITSKIGCMHTATWMPGGFFITKPKMMFPLTLKLIDEKVIVNGSYNTYDEVPLGSMLLEINKKPIEGILEQLRIITSADALNPYFIDAQIMQRFSMFYASIYGLPDQYEIKFLPPGQINPENKILTPADHESVRKVVFFHFSSPPLGFEILKERNTAIMTVNTFIYYDKVDYFQNFMDSCFHLIRKMGIDNLILDVRGNTGGDPFCSSILLSYLQKSPVPYFAEAYGKYSVLANYLPIPEDHFRGRLYIIIDGSCGSTNGHFSALLKYHKMGKFIRTPSGSTYKCNAGRNTEFRLKNTQMIITIGRSTYAAAVEDMAKTAIMPDIYVKETYSDYLENRDAFLEMAFEQIEIDNQ